MTGAPHSRRATLALQKLAEVDPALASLALWCGHQDADAPAHDPAPRAWTDGRTIFYGPAFEALPLPEQIGLAAHHILHVAFRHPARSQAMASRLGERFDADLYNVAADAILNEAVLLAGYALPRPCVTVAGLSAARADLPATATEALTTMDTERLYMVLAAPGAGRGGEGETSPTEARRAEAAEQGYAADLETAGIAPDADRETDSEEAMDWRQRVSRAMAEGRRAGRGLGALGFRLADMPEARTPWERVLRRLLAEALLPDARLSHRAPDRHWLAREADARARGAPTPVFQPAVIRTRRVPRLAVCLDCSGSIDAGRLGLFAAEIAGLARRTGAETHVLVFDDEVRARTTLGPGRLEREIMGIAFARDGGTSFVAPLAEADRLHPAAIVVLTDLDGPTGPAPAAPVLWCVPGGTHPRPPFGRVISLAR